jgi:transposase
MIEDRKDITLNEMVARLEAERSMLIGRSALSAWLRGHGWTYKKSPHTHWSRIAPTS